LEDFMAKGRVFVDERLCKGCSLCVINCPMGVLELDSSKLNEKGYNPATPANADKCTGCAICALMCPDVAITVERGDD
jgi:2-oxoglutarate ferredoxin oxidoreductase subunit delta